MNLYQDVVFRGLDLARGRHNVERLRFLRRSQYWTSEQLEIWQLDRLNSLLSQARKHSKFYAERLRDVPLLLRSLDELESIPPLTRAEIRQFGDDIRTSHLAPERYVLSRTGGSTGEPTRYFWDKRGQDWNRASVYRSAEWAGGGLGTRTLNMSGSSFDEQVHAGRLRDLENWILRNRDCPVAAPTRADFEDYRQQLHAFRPASIWGYSSGIDALAAYLEEVDPGTDYPFVRALVTSSETLRPEQRERMERVFGAGKVFDQYGAREMYVASECRAHAGYHVHAEVVLVEVVDSNDRPCAPGERGRVLVTDLSNHAFPFVRYEVGDVAVAGVSEPCGCGVTLPRLERVEGRVSDLVVLEDRILTAPGFCHLFTAVDGVRSFQVRQDATDRIRVLIDPGPEYGADVEGFLMRALEAMVEGRARIEIVTDEPIMVPESGKRRFVISEVASGAL